MSVRVETIFFDSPKSAGVTTTLARDVSITGNVFTNVQFGGLIHANGIILATRVAHAAEFVGAIHAPFIYPAITGNVVADGNVIDGVGTEIVDTHWGECFGHLALATSGTLRFERNQIRNIGRQADGTGPVRCFRNDLGAEPANLRFFLESQKDQASWAKTQD